MVDDGSTSGRGISPRFKSPGISPHNNHPINSSSRSYRTLIKDLSKKSAVPRAFQGASWRSGRPSRYISGTAPGSCTMDSRSLLVQLECYIEQRVWVVLCSRCNAPKIPPNCPGPCLIHCIWCCCSPHGLGQRALCQLLCLRQVGAMDSGSMAESEVMFPVVFSPSAVFALQLGRFRPVANNKKERWEA